MVHAMLGGLIPTGDKYKNVCTHYCKLFWIRVFTKMENELIDHFSFHIEIGCIRKSAIKSQHSQTIFQQLWAQGVYFNKPLPPGR
jgi:hypothetical protein